MIVEVHLSIGYPTAEHEDKIEIPDEEIKGLTYEERVKLIDEYAQEWAKLHDKAIQALARYEIAIKRKLNENERAIFTKAFFMGMSQMYSDVKKIAKVGGISD